MGITPRKLAPQGRRWAGLLWDNPAMPALSFSSFVALVAVAIAVPSASCDSGTTADPAGAFCVEESCAEGLVCHRNRCMARADIAAYSGGCTIKEVDAAITHSFPSHFSDHDTIGARWNCMGDARLVDKDMEAYALCAGLVVAKGAGTSP